MNLRPLTDGNSHLSILHAWRHPRPVSQREPPAIDRIAMGKLCVAMLGSSVSLAVGDEAAPVEEKARRVVARLLDAEQKLREIKLTIDNPLPAR